MNVLIDNEIVIVSPSRTPLGGPQGSLCSLSAPILGGIVVQDVLQKSGLAVEKVEELLFGCVLTAGLGQSPARQVALGAGLPISVTTTTVNKVCGSGMKAVMMAYDQIKVGSSTTIIAGGMESMSNAPFLLQGLRKGCRPGHKTTFDHMFLDGLQDAESKSLMGLFAQQTADQLSVTREEMDGYAIASLQRAQTSIANGYFTREIVPVEVTTEVGSVTVCEDEQPGLVKLDKIPFLKPAFAKDGSITAANSSSISDGAAAMLITTQGMAEQEGLQVAAKIVAHSSHAQSPGEFCTAPISAIQKVLDTAQWRVTDVDLFEINEAFALVSIAAMKSLQIPHEKMNVNGGACALGHPLGASGARIIVTLIHALKRLGKTKGVASVCIGGGEATAIAIEIVK
jgi:acetyl-CoA C-acetyltransferase